MDQPAETPANESLPKTPWGVGIRLGIASAGAALLSLGLARRGRAGALFGAVGVVFLLSALLNKPPEGCRTGEAAARDQGEERKRGPSPDAQSQRPRDRDETVDPLPVDERSADFGPYAPRHNT